MIDQNVAQDEIEAMRGECAQVGCDHVIAFDDAGETGIVVFRR